MYSNHEKDFYVMQARQTADKAEKQFPPVYHGNVKHKNTPEKNMLSGLLTELKEDDLLIIGLIFIIFNEHNDDDFLILLILAILFFT